MDKHIPTTAILVFVLLATCDAFAPFGHSTSVTRAQHLIGTGRFLRQGTVIGATDSSDSVDITMSAPASDTSITSSSYQFVSLVGKSASSVVSISFFLLLASRRDALTLTLFIGSIFNAVSSKVLKKILNHQRPANLQRNENVKLKPSDGGMVSVLVPIHG